MSSPVSWFSNSGDADGGKTSSSDKGKSERKQSARSRRSISMDSDEASSSGTGIPSQAGKKGGARRGGNEVGALVFMLKDSVSQLSSMEDVEGFHKGFSIGIYPSTTLLHEIVTSTSK